MNQPNGYADIEHRFAFHAATSDEKRLAHDHYQSLLPVFAQRIDRFINQTQKLYP